MRTKPNHDYQTEVCTEPSVLFTVTPVHTFLSKKREGQFNGHHQTGNTNPSMPVSGFLMGEAFVCILFLGFEDTTWAEEDVVQWRFLMFREIVSLIPAATSRPENILSHGDIRRSADARGLSTWEFEGLGGWVNISRVSSSCMIICWIIPRLTECSLRLDGVTDRARSWPYCLTPLWPFHWQVTWGALSHGLIM